MNPNEIRRLLKAEPFQPFRIHMSNGRTFDVLHPELAYLTERRLEIAVDVNEDGLPRTTESLAMLHIASLEELTKR